MSITCTKDDDDNFWRKNGSTVSTGEYSNINPNHKHFTCSHLYPTGGIDYTILLDLYAPNRATVKPFFVLKNFFSHFVSWRERFVRVLFVPNEYFFVHKNARPKTDPNFFWPCGRDGFRANTCRKCAASGKSTLFANSRTPERFPNNLDMASNPRCSRVLFVAKTLILFVQGLFCIYNYLHQKLTKKILGDTTGNRNTF